jgi:hypothetical protein
MALYFYINIPLGIIATLDIKFRAKFLNIREIKATSRDWIELFFWQVLFIVLTICTLNMGQQDDWV